MNESPIARRITDPLMVRFEQAIEKFNEGKFGDLSDPKANGVKDTTKPKKVAQK